MKKLIGTARSAADELWLGMSLAHPEFTFSGNPRFVSRPLGAREVALVSGGGSGHEPLHAGYVGPGMLAAACPGNLFTAPTPDQIVAAVRALAPKAGVLLIIKNYTGDRLNFEAAAEQIHAAGIPVGVALVDDDVAVKDSLYTAGRRGVAGTVLIEKLLGARAAEGASLDELEALAVDLGNSCRSLGIALEACEVPHLGKPSFSLSETEYEFGVGIHGEPGIERRPFQGLRPLVTEVFEEIQNNQAYERPLPRFDRSQGQFVESTSAIEPFRAGDRFIVLVNGMGSTPLHELYGVYGEIHRLMEAASFKAERVLVGNYCTSLDMRGFSISLLRCDPERLRLWDAPVQTAQMGWQRGPEV